MQGPHAAELAKWGDASVAGGRVPSPEATPGKVAGFFRGLTGAESERLAERFPYVVGNLNGAPVELRYHANRVALTKARETEQARSHDSRLSPEGRKEAHDRLKQVDRLLRDGRQVLAFDPTGRGRVAEVLGDLDQAQRVSVVVPGVDTDLSTYDKPWKPYAAPAGMARDLYNAERAQAPHTRTAVIAWADYTTPEGVGVDAATEPLAADGADRLQQLVAGLPGHADTALFCHSYGSVACGVAASGLPDRVTDITVAGSPGMRVDSARELRTDARVWAARGATDWIQDVPHLEVAGLGHGSDPVAASFGARRISADGTHGHAEYFRKGTASLANFAAIGTGGYPAVTCDSSDTDCSAPLDLR
ncbi:hypothetical protein G5C51_34130 [Streptomyces sp. A7024]|uniref:DUF1023 domain-containing protein n=2 Tax=Streptomyces coryli TaxID=1128680 RepID=A0A6G4U9L3_9ACTN|nr:alpha/beta hydrolase [Streptomyces coryli]NGN68919.1 hypothetical protein [Streptomyces coryli]